MGSSFDIHPYQRDPQSGAGNCRCGHSQHAKIHPHEAMPRSRDRSRCVCGDPVERHPDWLGHQ